LLRITIVFRNDDARIAQSIQEVATETGRPLAVVREETEWETFTTGQYL